jgi:putative lipoprotein (rSAM/lipoprotein system)
MFKFFKEKKQKLLRFLFGSFSFTALMFTFQACYGMPERSIETVIQGRVTDMETNEPIEGLQVTSDIVGLADTTDQNGQFIDPMGKRAMYEWEEFRFTVTDIDDTENGQYETLDTVLPAIDLTQPLQLKVKKVSDAQ